MTGRRAQLAFVTSVHEKVTNKCNIHCWEFVIVVLSVVGKVFIAMEGIRNGIVRL